MARTRRTAAEWARLLEAHASSGTTVAQFCEASGISVPSFYVWKRRLRSVPRGANGQRPRKKTVQRQASQPTGLFHQVSLPPILGAGPVTVRFASGAEMTFPGDPAVIRQVVDQLLSVTGSAAENRSC